MPFLDPEAAKAINLAEYAAGLGYERDRQRSTRSSWSMKHPDGHRIVVSRAADGHWRWFSATGAEAGGSIIDFVMFVHNLSFREACALLAEGHYRTVPIRNVAPLQQRRPVDVVAIAARLARMGPVFDSSYLNARGIPVSVYTSPVFAGRVLQGYNDAVIFPHFRGGRPTGYEIKGPGLTSFPGDGDKALWVSRVPRICTSVAIAESGVEALSYAVAKPAAGRLYVSTGGAWSSLTNDDIRRLCHSVRATRVIAAFNNDVGGRHHTDRLEKILAPDGVAVVPDFPPQKGDDWNDFIRQFDMSK
ncbi:MAG: toprim domain-containing protein [Puniceicoccales bacterium]